MNTNAPFARDLERWLQTEAPASAPAGFHASVIDRARTVRQRPGWVTSLPVRRLGRGRGITLFAAAALVLVGGAVAATSGILRLPTVVPRVPAPSVIAVATASPDAAFPSPSESAAPTTNPIPVAGAAGVWTPTGSMGTPRFRPTALRLQDGTVLVVGGLTGEVGYQFDQMSAELYDPATGTWSAAGSISKPLIDATLLHDGKVLVLVGQPDGGPRSTEAYDPATGTWTATGPMDPGAEESGDAFTVLRDGRVLLAGAEAAQVYDPASGTWTATGPLVRECCGTVAVLQDGRVLDTGGAQLFDPASGTWTATAKRNNEGVRPGAALLSDGKVLVVGGRVFTQGKNSIDEHDLDSAEVYDPGTGSWTATANMHAKLSNPTGTFLGPDGKVLVVASTSIQVYDPTTGTWTEFPVRPGIDYHAAAQLSDGTVLVAAGGDGDAGHSACTAVDLYDPRTGSWTTDPSMLRCSDNSTFNVESSFTPLLDGTVLSVGGIGCDDGGECASSSTAELYVPAGVALPPLPAFPSPPPFVMPSPTPLPPLLPPESGPVPPNARRWTVTVENRSSEPATLSVAEGGADSFRLVGSATPNVVPAGKSVKVTFLFPAKEATDGAWITVNRRQGEGAETGPAGRDSFGIPGKIVISTEGDTLWVSP